MSFQIGNKVQWCSSSNGRTKAKEGVVVEIVPAGAVPSRSWLQLHRGSGIGMPRDHESYVVIANRKQYWPRVNKLYAL